MDQEYYDRLMTGLQELLSAVSNYQSSQAGATLVSELTEHIGADPRSANTVEVTVLPHRVVDYDIAVRAVAERDPGARLVGLGGEQKQHMTLADMIAWSRHQAVTITRPEYVQLPCGPGEERSCLRCGLWLFTYRDVPVAVLCRSAQPNYGRQLAAVEILCLEVTVAGELAKELDAIAVERSVLRGQVLTFDASPFEPDLAGVGFVPRPTLSADEVILPLGRLETIRGHVIGIAAQRDVLRAHGQHLKRGVLLYGPPGTGKTHTVRHLLSATPGHTVILLSGQTLAQVTVAAQTARALQPAIVVLEDCDLVAEDRHLFDGSKPLLFEVMDAMDGLEPDADVTFLLTTNRIEAMERALTQRPGRVDLAVEVPLPDLGGRRKLLDLYSPADTFTDAALDRVAEKTEGATASLFKELVRRAVLAAALAGDPVGDAHLERACDDLTGDADRLSARLLGHRPSGAPFGLSDYLDDDELPGEVGLHEWPGQPAHVPPTDQISHPGSGL